MGEKLYVLTSSIEVEKEGRRLNHKEKVARMKLEAEILRQEAASRKCPGRV